MLAREYLPKLGFKPPICIHMPILLGLDGTKMSSSKGNFISVEDDADEIERKIGVRSARLAAQQRKIPSFKYTNISFSPLLRMF